MSSFFTKVENADMRENSLFERFYTFSEHFLRRPRFPQKWKMRTLTGNVFCMSACPLFAGGVRTMPAHLLQYSIKNIHLNLICYTFNKVIFVQFNLSYTFNSIFGHKCSFNLIM